MTTQEAWVRAERDGALASRSDADLARAVEYRNIAGEAHAACPGERRGGRC